MLRMTDLPGDSDDSDDWIAPELAEQILEQDRLGEWSEAMTPEEVIASLEKAGQSLH